MKTSEFKIQETLEDFFNSMAFDPDTEVEDIANCGAFEGCECRTYKEAGMLTSDKGLVIRTADGQEFVITIQKRR